MPRCGVCDKVFDKAKDLMDHIRNNCEAAKVIVGVVDSIIPEADGRGVLSIGVGSVDVEYINKEDHTGSRDAVELTVEYVEDTDLGQCISDGGVEVWILKSQIMEETCLGGDTHEISIPEWLAHEKGLI